MWYSNAYRRHLCDMHIEEWNEEFFSKFSPEKYVENLLLAKVQSAMIYFQSHVGLCYYPTKVGEMHKAFIGKEDTMKQVIQLCHENGIAVTGYYSLNYNTREHDKHPGWRMRYHDGKSRRERGAGEEQLLKFESVQQARYGICCPNNGEYRKFVYQQIDEMLDYVTVEGMFFDMPFWPHTCYCKECSRRWAEEVGGDIPIDPVSGSEEHKLLITKKHQWMGEWIQSVTDYVKGISPDISVEHNFAQSIESNSNSGCGEEVCAACDYVGGDLYGGSYNHSLACKFYKNITKNAPFEYMFSRCKPALQSHTLTKTYDEMLTEVMLTVAHHGATLVIDAIDPVGTQDERFYKRIGEVFELQKKYEPYFIGKMREDVGLYYSMRSRCGAEGVAFNNKSCACVVAETFIKHKVPFGITGSFHDIADYKLLVYPMVNDLEEADNSRILQYVANGGNLYISGIENPTLLEELLDCKVIGRTMENITYIAPEAEYEALFWNFNAKYPLMFDGTAPIIKMADNSCVVANITLPYTKPDESAFASIHSNPPGIPTEIPAVVVKKYGQGCVIWSGLNIEAVEIYEYREIFMNLVYKMIDRKELSFSSNAPEHVELTVFDNEHSVTVNVIDMKEEAVAKELAPFEISVRTKQKPERVVLLPEKAEISFTYENGFTCFTAHNFKVFEMYEINFDKS